MSKKISELTTATDVTVNDFFQVVDLEDPTMATSGTNKKVSARTLGNNLPVTATGSSASRTLRDRFADTVNVKDFGAVGDGVTNDTAAFQAAHSAVPNGKSIYVPTGTYKISTVISCVGRRWLFEGSTFFPLTNLNGALISYVDSATGAVENGVGNPYQYGSKYKFGGNHHGPIGLQIGGAEKLDGPNGMVAFADGYSGWTTLTPSQYPSSAELAIQPTSIAGSCSVVSGGNTVTKITGGDFIPEIVGKRFYFGQGLIYKVSAYVSPTQITVTNLNDSTASFGSSGTFTFVIAYAKGIGTCNTNGTSVIKISGDPFVSATNTEYSIKINGTTYLVSSITSENEIILTSSAGIQTNVAYEFWTSVDNISSALRVHRISGAGFEENVTLGAYGDGYFHLLASGGTTRQYPFYIGSGYDSQGKRKQITIDGTSGNIGLGGNYDRFTLECNYPDAPSNWTYFEAGIAGTSSPTISSKGPDANIDLRLTPKGTGRVRYGTNVATADVPITGYIEIKDAAGTIRKLAVIA